MIKVEHLTKDYSRPVRQDGFLGSLRTLFSAQYQTTRALDDISFHIEEGELVGYIGPNSAGNPFRYPDRNNPWFTGRLRGFLGRSFAPGK